MELFGDNERFTFYVRLSEAHFFICQFIFGGIVMSKKLLLTLCVLCVAVFCISALTVSVFATDTTEVTSTTVETERTVTASGTCGAEGDNLTWTLYDDGELVISGTGAMKDYANNASSRAPWYSYRVNNTRVVIEKGVTSIGSFAFYGHTNLVEIEIPESVTSIGEWAFWKCALKSIELPSGLLSIGEAAFQFAQIESVTIPASCATIEYKAFGGCDSLKEIIVAEENANYAAVNGVLFTKDLKTLHTYPCAMTTASFVVPEGTESIGDWAFWSHDYIETVSFPASLMHIGISSISGCASINNVSNSNVLSSIGNSAFSMC